MADGLQAGLQRITLPGYWVTLLLEAVQTGFSGGLSTVSTFVAEVGVLGLKILQLGVCGA